MSHCRDNCLDDYCENYCIKIEIAYVSYESASQFLIYCDAFR